MSWLGSPTPWILVDIKRTVRMLAAMAARIEPYAQVMQKPCGRQRHAGQRHGARRWRHIDKALEKRGSKTTAATHLLRFLRCRYLGLPIDYWRGVTHALQSLLVVSAQAEDVDPITMTLEDEPFVKQWWGRILPLLQQLDRVDPNLLEGSAAHTDTKRTRCGSFTTMMRLNAAEGSGR